MYTTTTNLNQAFNVNLQGPLDVRCVLNKISDVKDTNVWGKNIPYNGMLVSFIDEGIVRMLCLKGKGTSIDNIKAQAAKEENWVNISASGTTAGGGGTGGNVDITPNVIVSAINNSEREYIIKDDMQEPQAVSINLLQGTELCTKNDHWKDKTVKWGGILPNKFAHIIEGDSKVGGANSFLQSFTDEDIKYIYSATSNGTKDAYVVAREDGAGLLYTTLKRWTLNDYSSYGYRPSFKCVEQYVANDSGWKTSSFISGSTKVENAAPKLYKRESDTTGIGYLIKGLSNYSPVYKDIYWKTLYPDTGATYFYTYSARTTDEKIFFYNSDKIPLAVYSVVKDSDTADGYKRITDTLSASTDYYVMAPYRTSYYYTLALSTEKGALKPGREYIFSYYSKYPNNYKDLISTLDEDCCASVAYLGFSTNNGDKPYYLESASSEVSYTKSYIGEDGKVKTFVTKNANLISDGFWHNSKDGEEWRREWYRFKVKNDDDMKASYCDLKFYVGFQSAIDWLYPVFCPDKDSIQEQKYGDKLTYNDANGTQISNGSNRTMLICCPKLEEVDSETVIPTQWTSKTSYCENDQIRNINGDDTELINYNKLNIQSLTHKNSNLIDYPYYDYNMFYLNNNINYSSFYGYSGISISYNETPFDYEGVNGALRFKFDNVDMINAVVNNIVYSLSRSGYTYSNVNWNKVKNDGHDCSYYFKYNEAIEILTVSGDTDEIGLFTSEYGDDGIYALSGNTFYLKDSEDAKNNEDLDFAYCKKAYFGSFGHPVVSYAIPASKLVEGERYIFSFYARSSATNVFKSNAAKDASHPIEKSSNVSAQIALVGNDGSTTNFVNATNTTVYVGYTSGNTEVIEENKKENGTYKTFSINNKILNGSKNVNYERYWTSFVCGNLDNVDYLLIRFNSGISFQLSGEKYNNAWGRGLVRFCSYINEYSKSESETKYSFNTYNGLEQALCDISLYFEDGTVVGKNRIFEEFNFAEASSASKAPAADDGGQTTTKSLVKVKIIPSNNLIDPLVDVLDESDKLTLDGNETATGSGEISGESSDGEEEGLEEPDTTGGVHAFNTLDDNDDEVQTEEVYGPVIEPSINIQSGDAISSVYEFQVSSPKLEQVGNDYFSYDFNRPTEWCPGSIERYCAGELLIVSGGTEPYIKITNIRDKNVRLYELGNYDYSKEISLATTRQYDVYKIRLQDTRNYHGEETKKLIDCYNSILAKIAETVDESSEQDLKKFIYNTLEAISGQNNTNIFCDNSTCFPLIIAKNKYFKYGQNFWLSHIVANDDFITNEKYSIIELNKEDVTNYILAHKSGLRFNIIIER